jgi:hypothetical protein
VLLFEVATGSNPFAMGGEVATFNKISSLGSAAFLHVPIPPMVSPRIRSLIGKLILPDPSARLGMGTGGINLIKHEPLFAQHINWNTLYLDSSPLVAYSGELSKVIMNEDIRNFADTEGWNESFDLSQLKIDFDLLR